MNTELFTQRDFINLVAAGTVVILGLAFIFGARLKRNSPLHIPVAPTERDYHNIMRDIEQAADMGQVNELAKTVDRFFDLHYRRVSSETLQALYVCLLKAISDKRKQLHEQAKALYSVPVSQ